MNPLSRMYRELSLKTENMCKACPCHLYIIPNRGLASSCTPENRSGKKPRKFWWFARCHFFEEMPELSERICVWWGAGGENALSPLRQWFTAL
jgi:hypothetical protein